MTKRPKKQVEHKAQYTEADIDYERDELDDLFLLDERLERDFHDPAYRPWLKLCIQVNGTHDFTPLLDVMQSAPLPEKMRPFVRDLFERHGLIKGVRKDLRRTPLYEMTDSERELIFACEEVKLRVKGYGMNVADAIQQVVKNDGIDALTLENAYMGRHKPMRKMKERLKKRHLQT